MVEAIRKGLNEANERLQELGASIGTQQLEDGKDFNVESILSAIIEDLENRWGDVMELPSTAVAWAQTGGKHVGTQRSRS
jgi:hypothetical protein